MATTQTLFELIISVFFILISIFTSQVVSVVPEQCSLESSDCVDKSKALPLKIIDIASILVTSMIGVSSPLLTRSIPVLGPDRSLFVIVKAFAAGIILATGFMHVLPDSFDMLSSSCLPEKPWHKFPFSGFVAMFSAIGTLMVDSIATSLYSQRNRGGGGVIPENSEVVVEGGDEEEEVGGGHDGAAVKEGSQGTQLLRCRVVAMAEYKLMKKAVMAFFFAVTTPFGIALGMALSNSYRENSPSSLITVGLLNAASAGLLIYMALVDLLAADFMGPKLQAIAFTFKSNPMLLFF
ncbi:hypothetical protein TEA_020783 [Camellia sinensis var. sinensis]|uniref:Uncharacterized protein n=1 Tax=Camellia sinensis var. sinensis TaxID=542762 RepID=A0A4V3WKN4_CAMSN|nr:hypothetical protein TEA_020783 [Camellia sinensis var. sinensis]